MIYNQPNIPATREVKTDSVLDQQMETASAEPIPIPFPMAVWVAAPFELAKQ